MRLPCEASMSHVRQNDCTEPSLLEGVLRLHGTFRERLTPLRVTPLQAGVILFLQGHTKARMTEAAAALRVKIPTLTEVMKDLVRKRWVTRRYTAQDRRAVCLQLSRKGETLARRIRDSVRDVRE